MNEHEGDWAVITMSCANCTHHWVAVCPSDCEQLECPRCHAMTPVNEDLVAVE